MATQPSTGPEQPEPRKSDTSRRPQLVVVDLGKRQSVKKVKRLRKGRGKLMPRVERIVEELIEAGTVKADAQPVVIVVRERERMPMMWPFRG